jgi:hypothetical protein
VPVLASLTPHTSSELGHKSDLNDSEDSEQPTSESAATLLATAVEMPGSCVVGSLQEPSPAETAADEVLVSVLKQLAAWDSCSPRSAAAAQFVWFRNALRQVCKRWDRLLKSTLSLWGSLIVDAAAEVAYVTRRKDYSSAATFRNGQQQHAGISTPVVGAPVAESYLSQTYRGRFAISAPYMGGLSDAIQFSNCCVLQHNCYKQCSKCGCSTAAVAPPQHFNCWRGRRKHHTVCRSLLMIGCKTALCKPCSREIWPVLEGSGFYMPLPTYVCAHGP